MSDTYAELSDALADASRLAEKLAEEHDEMVDERDSYKELWEGLNAVAREAGYQNAEDAMDDLVSLRDSHLRNVLEDHHDEAGHGGPLRFCSDRLCSSVVAA